MRVVLLPPLFFPSFFPSLSFLSHDSPSRGLNRAHAMGWCQHGSGSWCWHPRTVHPFFFPGKGWDLRVEYQPLRVASGLILAECLFGSNASHKAASARAVAGPRKVLL